MSRKTLIQGTVILTGAGLITRFMGFFYKIFLSRSMGTEMLGIYQLIFPVYGICFTIYASGMQTAISKLAAEKPDKRILESGCLISLLTAITLSAGLIFSNNIIADRFLLESGCSSSLRILSFVFPFCSITSCINGYYYGIKKSMVPAVTQIIEQAFRILTVMLFSINGRISCELAIMGIVVGEAASCCFNILSLRINNNSQKNTLISVNEPSPVKKLLVLSLPLTSNRLLINLLHSFEAILFPLLLRKNGIGKASSLSILGILNGMSMPLLMFPGTIVGSLSVLLLPEISEAAARGNREKISSIISRTTQLTATLGIMFMAVFLIFGNELGVIIYGEASAGHYLYCLSWLCPFIYITTTLSSILNGLGKAHITFINSIISGIIRILMMLLLIPVLGIYGYFIAELAGQLLAALLDLIAVCRNAPFHFNALDGIIKPSLICLLSGVLYKKLFIFLHNNTHIPSLALLLGICALFCLTFIIFLTILSKSPFKYCQKTKCS